MGTVIISISIDPEIKQYLDKYKEKNNDAARPFNRSFLINSLLKKWMAEQ